MNPESENLINSLVNDGYLKTPSIIDAFKKIDRADFVLDGDESRAYLNVPLSIGYGQTISQPLTVAFMLELLQPRAGEKILEIGAGSGWQTAILGEIISKRQTIITAEGEETASSISGKVVSFELIPELMEMAEKNVFKYSFIGSTVEIILGDGSKGYKKESPYDRIIAAAAVGGEMPAAWKRQLKIGGRIVTPVENSIVVVDKISQNKYLKKEYFGFSFVPLIEAGKRGIK